MAPEGRHTNASYFGQSQPGPSDEHSRSAPGDLPVIATPISELPPPLPPSGEASLPSHPPDPAQRDAHLQLPVQQQDNHILNRQQSAIRLRRLRTRPPSIPALAPLFNDPNATTVSGHGTVSLRRRSSSDPQRPVFVQYPEPTTLPTVPEAASPTPLGQPAAVQVDPHRGGLHRLLGRRRQSVAIQPSAPDDCYDSRIVDFLDVVDPEVAALSSITNVQNSLFVPSLGRWVNRRPTYDLSQLPRIPGAYPPSEEDLQKTSEAEEDAQPTATRVHSFSSVLTDTQYAILPKDKTLEGWREEDIKLINDYVRHMLHSRRSKFKQRLKAFRKYASRPLGFLVTLYATLITLFGLAWVLFLIGWIYVGEKQLYVINVIDYILVALFAIVGDGLAPFRAIDTYHMFFVAHYHRKTLKLRKKLLLPKLSDRNDLPVAEDSGVAESSDPEATAGIPPERKESFFPVLTDKQQASLEYHQGKLAKSHTFYKPHETDTHHAFPLSLLVTVVLLLDLHSCLQITLGAITWGIPYETRPAAATTTVLCCSIATNAVAGVVITLGDRRTRKKDVLERLLKQDLTDQVMKKIKKEKKKEEEKEIARLEGRDGLLGLPIVEKIRKSSDLVRNSGEGFRRSLDRRNTSTSRGKGPGDDEVTSV
ncbi:hypothetical protein OQA88_6109 [Cercophora sp. LCS_1]